jgi:hypothetical protein
LLFEQDRTVKPGPRSSARSLRVDLDVDEAQRLTRWHYQWIILNEFLPITVGQELVDNILTNGRRFYVWRGTVPFIPVEFSVAAYRFGHSQVRQGYIANFSGDNGEPFLKHIFDTNADHDGPDPDDLSGGKRAPRRFVDWQTFFDVGPTPPGHENVGASPKPNKRIDTKLSSPLFELPFGPPNDPQTLAQRNLLRHLTFSLPSGQNVAKAMSIEPLSKTGLSAVKPMGFDGATPLWFYILKESELKRKARLSVPWARASWPRYSSAYCRVTLRPTSVRTRTGSRPWGRARTSRWRTC